LHTLAQLKAGELKGIKRLQLSEELTTFPMEILTLADSLEILDLSHNLLSTLPPEITQLTQLKILFVSQNCFTTLPVELGLCMKLEMIGFKSNQITSVPAGSLPPALRWLILTDNKISALPETLGNCTQMQKLALAGNQLTHLPASFDHLINLELLRISANQMAVFPSQLLTLPKLAWLAFSGNPFCQYDNVMASIPEVKSQDYALKTVLGQGASGVIYQANWTHPHFPNEVAVKVFKGDVTSDGYPQDELQACLKVGAHDHLVTALAQVNEVDHLALVMELIPARFKNLGLPPTLESCTRDTFPAGFALSINEIEKIVKQMKQVFVHLHQQQVCHGDLYAHNTLFDEQSNIMFGDFGAASMYHMLPESIQLAIKNIEARALQHFIDDLLSVCKTEDLHSATYAALHIN